MLQQKMIKIMRGYTNLTTVLTTYLPDVSKIKRFDSSVHESLDDQMSKLDVESDAESDFESDDLQPENVATHEKKESSSDDANYCSSEEGDLECPCVNVVDVESILVAGQAMSTSLPKEIFPKWLMDKSRLGLVNPDILTLLNLNTFFSTPQPECYDMTFSGEPYMRVLQCIAGLLLGPTEIHCWYRQHRNKYEETKFNTITETQSGNFPRLDTLEELCIRERKKLLHEILDVEDEHLSGVPDDWKLYIISICCWLRNDTNNELKPHHLHSVIMMMLTLLVVDDKIGFHRQRKSFVKKYGVAVGKISKTREKANNKNFPVFDSISDALEKVTKEDCILVFDSLLQNFQVEKQMRYSKQFSSTLVHSFARFQYCFNFTSMLNTVLCAPYPDIKVNAFYNGTFLYNTAVIFKKKSNVTACIDSFLANVPSLLGLYKVIYKTIQQMCPELLEIKPRKKARKPKSIPISEPATEILTFDSDSEPFYDKNNRFCVVFT